MKNCLSSLAILLLLTVLTVSCKKDECTGEVTVNYQTFDDFGGIGCGIIINDQSKGFNFVIDHQSGLESLVECSTLPVIDFEKYTLFLGSYESDKDLTYKSQTVIKNCETQTVTFSIIFDSEQKDTSMLVDYHAVIPKIPDDYEVEFEIQTWQVK